MAPAMAARTKPTTIKPAGSTCAPYRAAGRRVARMSRWVVHLLRAVGLVALSLVLAHEAVFLARYGSIYGEALQHSGHSAAWSDAVTVVVIGAALLLAGSAIGLYRLGRQIAARSATAGRATAKLDAIDLPQIVGRWLTTGAAIGGSALVLLTVQENLEHLSAGLGAPGVGILLSPEYPFAVLITLGASIGVALVATLLAWRHDALVRRLRALVTHRHHAPARVRQPRSVRLAPQRGSILARRLGRRAPPVLLAA
jgi:hypothetical protein